jgi:hypothetical protein
MASWEQRLLPLEDAVSYDGNGSAQYASNEEVDATTAIHFEPLVTTEPNIVTHIGIPQAQESEYSSESYRVRRCKRAHMAREDCFGRACLDVQ